MFPMTHFGARQKIYHEDHYPISRAEGTPKNARDRSVASAQAQASRPVILLYIAIAFFGHGGNGVTKELLVAAQGEMRKQSSYKSFENSSHEHG